MSTTPKRVALYARVSTKEQSVDPQLDELRAVAQLRGWRIVKEFTDHGISGSRDSRPALDQLIKLTHTGKVDLVMVVKFDRWARSLRHLITSLDDFRSRGIDFVSSSNEIDTTSPAGRLMFVLLAGMAEFEKELVRERTLAGLATARRQGRRLGRRPTRVNEEKLLQLREQGLSLREIALQLGISKSLVAKRLSESVL